MPKELVLGIGFFNGSCEEACQKAEQGGLIVAPSGPGLAGDLLTSASYREALLHADVVLADSGLLCLWTKVFRKTSIQRISGLLFLKKFLDRKDWVNSPSLWIMPTIRESEASMSWLHQCYPEDARKRDVYVAPVYSKYGKIEDPALLAKIETSRPGNIMIQIGGGTQERLGLFLKDNLSYQPGIFCTGAALAFLSGQQVKIPLWADRLFLGWLFRCFHMPRRFVPRYFKAFKLFYLLLKYGSKCPVLTAPTS